MDYATELKPSIEKMDDANKGPENALAVLLPSTVTGCCNINESRLHKIQGAFWVCRSRSLIQSLSPT